jgi:CheY-like chemotaxis protein
MNLNYAIGTNGRADLVDLGIREIVIVDSLFDRYSDFVAAASEGAVGLHFCNDGLSALKLARRFRGDIWLVSTELPDMSGFDLMPILLEHVQQGGVDPLLNGPRISLESLGVGFHPGVFMVSDLYRIEEEQRALASGSAGYLVRPITLDLVKALREPHHDNSVSGTSVEASPSSSLGIHCS